MKTTFGASPRWLSRFLGMSYLLVSSSPLVSAAGYDLDIDSTDSIKKVSKGLVEDMLTYYHGDEPGNQPGLLPEPYFWWAAGAMMGTLVDYWYYTGDNSYVNLTIDGMIAQVGEHNDYMPRAQRLNEGNDDQGFWGLAAMAAAEYNFPNPAPDKPQWLALAQAVFNTQAVRWHDKTCGGGLRWQVYHWNKGYDYKNSISNGCFFAIAARLALFTGNTSYADWAEKTWDWTRSVDLIDDRGWVRDGIPEGNCSKITPYLFTYNSGVYLSGASAMYNLTGDAKWLDRVDLLLNGTKPFFRGPDKNIMTEVACEDVNRCNLDQVSFKAYLSRWMAATTKWAPETYDRIMPYLRASAKAAINQCTGGVNGKRCGLKWSSGKFDGNEGVGQQMSALEVTMSTMIKQRPIQKTAKTGGSSKGNPGAGGPDIDIPEDVVKEWRQITKGDQAGAAILTVLVVAGFFASFAFIMVDETSDKKWWQQAKDLKHLPAAAIAGATGGAVAGATLSKRDSNNEKADPATAVSERSSDTASDHGPGVIAVPSHARSRSEPQNQQRRLSSMPRGWPHNPSMRNSGAWDQQVPVAAGHNRSQSMQQVGSGSAAGPSRSNMRYSNSAGAVNNPESVDQEDAIREIEELRRRSMQRGASYR